MRLRGKITINLNVMQSKRLSIVESITSTLAGFVVSLLIQVAVYPLFDIHTTMTQNVWLTVIFTVASIVRGYVVRRMFNIQITALRLSKINY
jgi:hypothetical protein